MPTTIEEMVSAGWPGEPIQGIIEVLGDDTARAFLEKGWAIEWSPLAMTASLWATPPGSMRFWGVKGDE